MFRTNLALNRNTFYKYSVAVRHKTLVAHNAELKTEVALFGNTMKNIFPLPI